MHEDEVWPLLGRRAEEGRVPVLGLVGGTFDPVHAGHLALGRALLDELAPDAVLFVPAGNPSFKQGVVGASAQDRLRMVELALADAGEPRFAASACEVARPGVTYTADTLRILRAQCPPGTRMVFGMGADALATLHFWREAAEIAQLAEVAYASRAGWPHPAPDELERLERMGFRLHALGAALPDVSSTSVRTHIAHGKGRGDAVSSSVARYIDECGLYGRADETEGEDS